MYDVTASKGLAAFVGWIPRALVTGLLAWVRNRSDTRSQNKLS